MRGRGRGKSHGDESPADLRSIGVRPAMPGAQAASPGVKIPDQGGVHDRVPSPVPAPGSAAAPASASSATAPMYPDSGPMGPGARVIDPDTGNTLYVPLPAKDSDKTTALDRQAQPQQQPQQQPDQSATLERTKVGDPDFDATVAAAPVAAGSVGVAAGALGGNAQQRSIRIAKQSASTAKDAADAVYGRIQRVTHAGGAGESGLAHVIEMSAINSVGDLLITLALANSLFFSVQANEARSKVALYLVVTMVPFTLLAPLIGPLLDRLRSGRRFAMALTALVRGLLALVMARAIAEGGFAVYPAAFGCLAASKAFGISRAAVIPRVLPEGTTLVRANSRITIAALAMSTIATPIGLGLGKIGITWELGFAALIYFACIWTALRLPKFVDSNEGEVRARLSKRERRAAGELTRTMPDRRLRSVGASVMLGLRANTALKALSGFFSIFMAFLVREHPIDGLKPLTTIAFIAVAIALGSGCGSFIGGMLKARAPEAIVTASLAIAAAVAVVAAFYYGLAMVLALSFIAGVSPAMAKLSLDAMIQRDTAEAVRTSAFARSETVLQLAWVLGGGLALALPGYPWLGLGALAAGLSIMALVTAKSWYDQRWDQQPAVAGAGA
jgi:MFS family permease